MKRVHILKGQLRPVIWGPQTRDEMRFPYALSLINVRMFGNVRYFQELFTNNRCLDVRECWPTTNEHSNIEPKCLDERMEHGQVEGDLSFIQRQGQDENELFEVVSLTPD